jgi:DNA-binding GntR family transcriptional regulator
VDLDPFADDPLYVQLAAVLRDLIATGEIDAGTGDDDAGRGRRVPSAKTLAQQYGVAQGTAERALAMLREEGLIRSAMGRGHFVVPPAERGKPRQRGSS